MDTLLFLLFTMFATLAEAELRADGHTIDLIHRYSPKSPFYSSSMTLQERFISLARHSSSRYQHLKWLHRHHSTHKSLDTDIIPNNGDYLIQISIGVPPVEQFVIADTGSDLIWVQCQPCDLCYQQNTTIFDPQKSSTSKTLPCNSPFCVDDTLEFQCNNTANQCQYAYSYGDGSTVSSGIMFTDILALASTKNTQTVNSSIAFGCGFAQRGDFDTQAAGLIGLGGGRISLISQLGSSIANTFSYCLTVSTSNSLSKLRLGRSHVSAKQGTVATPLSIAFFPFYAIELRGISIGQNYVEINTDIVIDIGTTLTYLDPDVYSELEVALRDMIPTEPMPKPPEPDLYLCYDTKSGFKPPTRMVFHVHEGDIVLSTENFFADLGNHTTCLTIVPLEEDGADFMILGNTAQVNLEIEFNLDSMMVSFSPSSCALE